MSAPDKLPRAIAEGVLMPGDLDVPCAVLDDGRRVLTARGFQQVFAGAKDGKMGRSLDRLQPYLAANSLRPSEFVTLSNARAHAYDAQALVDVCRALSRARREGALHPKQEPMADRAQVILEALAGVGIAALVDEATGYQDKRPPNALQRLLKLFVRDETQGRAPWEIAWTEELDRELCRLYRQPFESGKRPAWLSGVRRRIYEVIQGKEVVAEIQRRNPNPSFGKNHHQLLTDSARRMLDADLKIVLMLARQSRTSGEFFARLRAEFLGEAFQYELGWT